MILNDEDYMDTITAVLYTFMFVLLLLLFNPLVVNYCEVSKIPYDMTLSINSIGFGNELTLMLAIVSIVLFHILSHKLVNFIINFTY